MWGMWRIVYGFCFWWWCIVRNILFTWIVWNKRRKLSVSLEGGDHCSLSLSLPPSHSRKYAPMHHFRGGEWLTRRVAVIHDLPANCPRGLPSSSLTPSLATRSRPHIDALLARAEFPDNRGKWVLHGYSYIMPLSRHFKELVYQNLSPSTNELNITAGQQQHPF